jgi:type I restriction enzyme S subunit
MTQYVRLGDVCGYDKRQGTHSGLPYLGLEQIESGSGRFDLSLSNPDAKSLTFRFSSKHVLYGRLRPYLKKVALPDTDGRCSTEIFPILPGSSLDRRFLAYWLLSDGTTAKINATCTGARMPRADMEAILDLQLFVPDLKEQHRIVALLDEAFAGIATAKANAEKSLRNAREVFDRELESAFQTCGADWKQKRLEELGPTLTGSTPKTSEAENFGNYMPFIKPGDFNVDGTLNYANEAVSEKGAAASRIVPPNSTMMVCIGATIGKCGHNDREVACNQQINAITPRDGSSNRFLHYQMLTRDFQRRVITNSGQATLPIINKSKWSALLVRLPPPEEQNRIVARLDTLRAETAHLQSLYTRKLAALDELKQSLLQRAFSGEL